MKFPYARYEMRDRTICRPTLSIAFEHAGIRIPVADALVDTGADQTLLPLSFATVLGFTFDLKKDGEVWFGAGGGQFRVFASPEPIRSIIECEGFRPIEWQGYVYFTLQQPTILLGHTGCLEKLDLIFHGKKKILEVSVAKI